MTQHRTSRSRWQLLAALYAATFALILVLAYTGNLPTYLTQYDKAGHIFLYCLATYIGHQALNYRRMKIWAIVVPLFPLLFGIFTATEEELQFFSPNRTLDALDLAASFTGILLGYWLAEKGRTVA